MEIKSVILAAGKGTRMKSETPKVLHKIFEKPLLGYVLDNIKTITNENFVIIGSSANPAAWNRSRSFYGLPLP